MSTRAHLAPCLQVEIRHQLECTISHTCGSNYRPTYRAPTPLTKDVSGEYPFSILPSLSFAVIFFPSLWLPPIATAAAVPNCWPLVSTFWSVPLTRL